MPRTVQSKSQLNIQDPTLSKPTHNPKLDAIVITHLVCLSEASREHILPRKIKDAVCCDVLKCGGFCFSTFLFVWVTSAVPNSSFSTWGKRRKKKRAGRALYTSCLCVLLFARKLSGWLLAPGKQKAALVKCSSQSQQCVQNTLSRDAQKIR